ncbi:MAG: LytR family transcriptional regulator, partial [Patulibacter sp.]
MSSQLPTNPRAPRPGVRFAMRMLLAGLIVVLAGAVTVTAAIRNEAKDIVDIIKEESQVDDATVNALDDVESGKPQTLLLVGDDYRASEGEAGGQRSDTMILLRLDPDSKATTMLSLPR